MVSHQEEDIHFINWAACDGVSTPLPHSNAAEEPSRCMTVLTDISFSRFILQTITLIRSILTYSLKLPISEAEWMAHLGQGPLMPHHIDCFAVCTLPTQYRLLTPSPPCIQSMSEFQLRCRFINSMKITCILLWALMTWIWGLTRQSWRQPKSDVEHHLWTRHQKGCPESARVWGQIVFPRWSIGVSKWLTERNWGSDRGECSASQGCLDDEAWMELLERSNLAILDLAIARATYQTTHC